MNESTNHLMPKRVFDQFKQLYFLPEIERRKKTGVLPAKFTLEMAQVIIFPDSRVPEIRFNDEIRAKLVGHLKKGIKVMAGQKIFEQDIHDITSVNLKDDEDPDCAHITFIKFQGNWVIAFDFRYNKNFSKVHRETANQFIKTAQYALDNKLWSACVENLFCACELAVKAKLLLNPDPKLREKHGHIILKNKYNLMAKLGNVNDKSAQVYNRLIDIRGKARYLQDKKMFIMSKKEILELMQGVENLLQK